MLRISIHAPRAGRDPPTAQPLKRTLYFNPRAPCGARRAERNVSDGCQHFNPRAPCGARRSRQFQETPRWHFNPRAPCGARRDRRHRRHADDHISIHAPRAGRDLEQTRSSGCYAHHFNPRAPCGARPPPCQQPAALLIFQSTRPVRGATTVFLHWSSKNTKFQSTRPVRGATAKVYKITLHTFATKGNF